MIETIAPISSATSSLQGASQIQSLATDKISFVEILSKGIEQISSKLVEADRLVVQFAIDDSVPLHQVTYALEQARLSFELMLQVRNRMLEATQQLMNMQI